jgi:hypothetical protein
LFSGVDAAVAALIQKGPAVVNKDAMHHISPTSSITTSLPVQGLRKYYKDDN